ncbi:AMP-binding protein [Mycobacterium sp.]|uniref:AMP-binding protein n=1 Tax=Mycobacterium sp. TaxID=1785 RepID=UPI0031D4058A
MTAPVPPIGAQISALAELAPDEPAVTCDGRTLGRPKLIESGGDSRIPAAIGYPLGAQQGDITLVPGPLSHNTGFTTATIALLMRHHLILMSRFEPETFLRLISDHGVTFLTTVPTIMQRCLPVYHDNPDGFDLSSLRRFWHLGAPCPPAIKQAWIDLLGPEKVWELYGGTDGFLYISDRRVDMFTVGGRNVYPAEIEAALSEHPDVLSCLVVGVPHQDLGQVPYALVQAGTALDEPTVQQFLRDRIAGYKVPSTVEFVDTPLRDDAGKARRSAVRARIMERLRPPDAG